MNKTKMSKFISLILRHHPEVIGISLDAHGWANVHDLLAGINADSYRFITMPMLEDIVASDEKGRYSFNADHTKIPIMVILFLLIWNWKPVFHQKSCIMGLPKNPWLPFRNKDYCRWNVYMCIFPTIFPRLQRWHLVMENPLFIKSIRKE